MKTTKKQYEMFKKECQKWIDKWELNNWEVVYEWKDLGKSTARMIRDVVNHQATLAFTKNYDSDFDKQMSENDYIKRCAKHEVIHLLLGRLAEYGLARFLGEDEMVEAEEELVRKLLKIL